MMRHALERLNTYIIQLWVMASFWLEDQREAFRVDPKRVLLARGLEATTLILIAILIITFGYSTLGENQEASRRVRGPVFLAFTIMVAVEALLMYLRTESLDWRRTQGAMFMARLAILAYIGSLAIQYGTWATFPDMYWDILRTIMGLATGYASAVLSVELVQTFRHAPRWRKRRAMIGVAVIAVLALALIIIF